MGDGISRRDVAILAGAIGLLSACDPSESDQSAPTLEEFRNALSGKLKIEGGVDPGDDVKEEIDPIAFNPQYIIIIHFSSDGAWHMNQNYAHFEIPNWNNAVNNTPEARLELAKKILLDKLDQSPKISRFKEIKDLDKKYRIHKIGDTVSDETNFIDFGFNSQHEIFVFFETKRIKLDPDNLVLFIPKIISGIPSNPNKTFYHGKIVKNNDMGQLNSRGQMFRYRNYMVDASAVSTIGRDPPLWYSMNFPYGVKDSSGQTTVVIIDPDTGNGAGNEP